MKKILFWGVGVFVFSFFVAGPSAKAGDYKHEGVGFYAFSSQISETLPVYRFYSPVSGDHFYTISEQEKDFVINNLSNYYTYEGVGFYAFSSQISEALPVYRFLNYINGDHFYTISEQEKDFLFRTYSPSCSVPKFQSAFGTTPEMA